MKKKSLIFSPALILPLFLGAAGGLFHPRAFSGDVTLLSENFESTPLDLLPSEWSLEEGTQPGGRAGWEDWKVKDADAYRALGSPRNHLYVALGKRALIADSDLYGKFDYNSAILTPSLPTQGSAWIVIRFDSGYRHNSEQFADLQYRWDEGIWQPILSWHDGDGSHVDEEDDDRTLAFSIRNPGGAASVQFCWRLRENFGWYWGIDNVVVAGLGNDSQPPAAPVAVSPVPGSTGVSLVPLLEAAAFSDPDPFDALAESQWQVIASGGDFNSPLFDSGSVASDATTFRVPGGILLPLATYRWRVRYRDLRAVWSDWSAPAELATGAGAGFSFTNIQPASGVTLVASRGGAWGDYDGDGYQDLWTGAAVYRNLSGSGRFILIKNLPNHTEGTKAGTAWADYNNDGWLDLFVGSQWLYENKGGTGTFVLHSTELGLDGDFPSQAVSWADYDLDGWVDVHVVGDQSAEGALYRNLGGTAFQNVTRAVGVADTREGYGGAWADADSDGDPDLFIANCDDLGGDLRIDVYFENRGGTFVERGAEVGLRETEDTWGVAWGDYDNDGDMDLFVVSTSGPNHFYQNNGGIFTDLRGQPGIPGGGNRDAGWGDFDNDGDLDLYLARTDGPNLLWRNEGDGHFTEVGTEAGVDDGGAGRVASIADMDNDGDLDIFVGNSGNTPVIYRNNLGPSHWLIVRLEGKISNRAAIGARVYATTGARTQMREVSGGGGLYTEHMLPVHFGLGSATQVDRLEVRWPSKQIDIVNNVSSNQILHLVESSPNQPPAAAFTADPHSGSVPLTVNFDASSSTDDGSIQSYEWDFGDGQSGAGVKVAHDYLSPGNYSVLLRVTDDQGMMGSASSQIAVDEVAGGLQFPGDCDQNGQLTLTDAICLLDFLFLGSHPDRLPCGNGTASDPANKTLLNFNADRGVDLSDAVGVLGYLFLGTKPHALGTSCLRIKDCPDNSAKCPAQGQ